MNAPPTTNGTANGTPIGTRAIASSDVPTALERRVAAALARWEDRLVKVERALNEEMARGLARRRLGVLMLLYRDKVLCDGLVGELRRLLAAGEEEA